jgi:hypothetical protein
MTKADRIDCLRTQMAGDRICSGPGMSIDHEVRDEAVPAYSCFVRISLSESYKSIYRNRRPRVAYLAAMIA